MNYPEEINFSELWHQYRFNKTPRSLDILAEKIGVEVLSLQMMECVWIEEHWAWGFPIVHDEKIVGIRLLNELGNKYYVKGSKDGSFKVNGEIDDDIAKIIRRIG